ncbi:Reticulocyte-binding protein 2-like protein a [Bienertia sinuspersici]
MERMVIMVKVKVLKNIFFRQSKAKGERGKYKSYIVDMKFKGRQSKLKVYIPDDVDRAIGDNARHFVNECVRVVRTRAPLNVKNWKEAFTIYGDAVESDRGGSYMKLQAFAVDTMQRLYRLWKARLHYYYMSLGSELTNEERLKYPPPNLPQDQWQYCVERFSSTEFKEQLKVAVATHGDSMTQEEILLDVLKPRSGYFRGKGTALRGYSKGSMQLEHQNLINKQQKQIQLQEQRIKELQETQEKTIKQLQEAQERTSKQLEQQREDMQRSMEEMKQQLLMRDKRAAIGWVLEQNRVSNWVR